MAEITILAGADREILEIYVLLEDFQPGLGDRFSTGLDRTLSLIGSNPGIGPFFRKDIRRMLVKGFPYAAFYTIEPTRIILQAVLDLRQSPEAIRRRLRIS